MTSESTSVSLDDFALPETIAAENPALFSKTAVRNLVRYRHENGLTDAQATVQVGSKIFVHRHRFAKWFSEQTK